MKRFQNWTALFLASALLAGPAAVSAGEPLEIVTNGGDAAAGRVDPLPEVTEAARAVTGSAPRVTPLEQSVLSGDAKSASGGLVCVVGWPVETLRELGYTPLLVGQRGGATGAQWVLIAREGATVESVKAGRIASPGLTTQARPALEKVLFKPAGLSLETLKHVQVSKGIDALLAVRNGQVELGLVDRAELEQAKKLVPQMTRGVSELRVSPELAFAVILARDPAADPSITEVTGRLKAREGGARGGIDRWVPVKP